MPDQIKFGTDGWRAIIADTYTLANVRRVAHATALYMKESGLSRALIGHDCRFGGEMFLQEASRVIADQGIQVHYHEGICTTPMISLGLVAHSLDMGVVITASHNPPSYNGYKLKSAYGGPTIPAEIAAVEALIPDGPVECEVDFSTFVQKGTIKKIDLAKTYVDAVRENFDVDAINAIASNVAYDAMYGAGFVIIDELFPSMQSIHNEYNPSFHGQAPEPIHRNLTELSEMIAADDQIKVGFANDGDADRIGMYDEHGNFVDSHHLLLLLLYYLHEEKNLRGKVIVTFSVTDKMVKLAEHFGLDIEVTKIGFKYIAEIMTQEDVLVGGEESGGLAVKGHVPERDGIWIALLILEFMSKSGKTLSELCQDIYDIVGSFSCDRYDLHITEDLKARAIQVCKNEPFTDVAGHKVTNTESTDGYKFFHEGGGWLMIRPSGTEPVLRVYAQSATHEETIAVLDAMKARILAL